MNTKSSKIVFLLAISAVALAAQDGVMLKLNLKPGKDSYKIETNVKQVIQLPNGMGEQEIKIDTSSDLDVVIKSVGADGYADVEALTSNVDIKSEGQMAGMLGNTPKSYKSTYKMDAFGRTKDMKTEGFTEQQQMMMSSFAGASSQSIIFPDKPVKPGDEWDVPVPKNPAMAKDQVLKAKLIGEKEIEGIKVWVIATSGPLTMAMDLSKMMEADPNNPAAGMKMTMGGVMEVSGETYLEQGTFRVITSIQKAVSKMKMEMPDMGMTMDIGGTTTTKMTLKQ